MEWKDVHSNTELVTEIDSELEQKRERLHAVDEHGQIHIGFDAILIIWQHSPNKKWIAMLLSLPIIKQLGQVAYNQLAVLLYKWNRVKKNIGSF